MNRDFLRETNSLALSTLKEGEVFNELSAISKISLQEASIAGYIEKKPFLFLFGRGQGAVMVVFTDEGKYNVLTFKTNRVISTGLLPMAPGRKNYDFLAQYAASESVLKKNYRDLSGKELKALLLQKEGVSLAIFDKFFPELNTPEAIGGEHVAAGGMMIFGINAFKKTDHVIKVVEKAASIIKSHGFSRLLYGEMHLIGSAMSSRTLADYSPDVDKIRLKVNERDEESMVKTILHELGHRQYYKFKADKKAIGEKYWEARKNKPIYKPGTVFIAQKTQQTIQITGRSYNRNGDMFYTGFYTSDPKKSDSLKISPAAVNSGNLLSGEPPEKSQFHVSDYAMTNEREFFAEVFAFGLMRNDKVLVKWIKEVTS